MLPHVNSDGKTLTVILRRRNNVFDKTDSCSSAFVILARLVFNLAKKAFRGLIPMLPLFIKTFSFHDEVAVENSINFGFFPGHSLESHRPSNLHTHVLTEFSSYLESDRT
eukprot:4915529-Heterocapsa_arctica.AAC.1